jgi:hypothetical protein
MHYKSQSPRKLEKQMPTDQPNAQSKRPSRAKKLSPELNEFLHMLNALEGQTGTQQDSTA